MALVRMGTAHYIITDSVHSLQRDLWAQWPQCRGDAHFIPVGSAHAEEGALRVSNRGLWGWRGSLVPKSPYSGKPPPLPHARRKWLFLWLKAPPLLASPRRRLLLCLSFPRVELYRLDDLPTQSTQPHA